MPAFISLPIGTQILKGTSLHGTELCRYCAFLDWRAYRLWCNCTAEEEGACCGDEKCSPFTKCSHVVLVPLRKPAHWPKSCHGFFSYFLSCFGITFRVAYARRNITLYRHCSGFFPGVVHSLVLRHLAINSPGMCPEQYSRCFTSLKPVIKMK